ncbi:hypothetical protein BpHYR1_000675 [Brachionus plicatilis]|uniref:Uncharacterized protein n=1 Tax=Brachionus plicatilis TaxID=10195 RepID=A0A3M7R6I3_BRAPC|nr:hypothetical protein BpHYR1_000675 [Brachionus plicatilis]
MFFSIPLLFKYLFKNSPEIALEKSSDFKCKQFAKILYDQDFLKVRNSASNTSNVANFSTYSSVTFLINLSIFSQEMSKLSYIKIKYLSVVILYLYSTFIYLFDKITSFEGELLIREKKKRRFNIIKFSKENISMQCQKTSIVKSTGEGKI